AAADRRPGSRGRPDAPCPPRTAGASPRALACTRPRSSVPPCPPTALDSKCQVPSNARREAEPGQRLAQDLRQELLEGAPREPRDDTEGAVRRERRERVHLEEVRAAGAIEPEVGPGEVPALERVERAPSQRHQLGLKRGVQRTRGDVTPTSRR